MNQRITLEIPSESLLSLKLGREQAASELCLAAAVKLYELGKLSSGAAATLVGVPKPLFLTKLADYGVDTFTLSEEDLEQRASTRLAALVLLNTPDYVPLDQPSGLRA